MKRLKTIENVSNSQERSGTVNGMKRIVENGHGHVHKRKNYCILVTLLSNFTT
jgi:hypothetical protein